MENKVNDIMNVSQDTVFLYETITKRTVENIMTNSAPWQKHFRQSALRPSPYNPASGKGGHVYGAFNRIVLTQSGNDDPRYVTFDQARDMDLLVKQGANHYKVVNFKTHDYVPVYDPQTGEIARDDKNRQIKQKVNLPEVRMEVHKVFNANQLQTKNYEDIPLPEFNPDVETNYAYLDSIFNWADLVFNPDVPKNANDISFRGPWLREDETDLDKAHCDVLRNIVALAHAELADDIAPPGTMAHAKNELTEQIATWLLTEDLGVYHVPKEGDYRSQWINLLEQQDMTDPFILAGCAQMADKIKDYVLDLENVKDAKRNNVEYYKADVVDMAKVQLWHAANSGVVVQVELDGKMYTEENINLDDNAKYLADKAKFGVKKDTATDKWYLEAGSDIRPVSKYLPLKQFERDIKVQSPEQEFTRLLEKQGFVLPSSVILDGEYHNVPVQDGKSNDGLYRAIIREDNVPQLFFCNDATGNKGFCPYSGGQLTDPEIARLKENAARLSEMDRNNRAVAQEQALNAAFERYNAAGLASENHVFFTEHGLEGLNNEIYRQDENGALLVPRVALVNSPDAGHVEYQVRSFQHIDAIGMGYSEKGCKKTGTMYVLDTPKMDFAEKTVDTIVIAQSLESGITLKNCSEIPVVVAFEAFNIKPVAEAVREHFPEAKLYICPDNSKDLSRNESVAKAMEAAEAIGARFVNLPEHDLKAGFRSFNDLRKGLENNAAGLKAVKECVLDGQAQNIDKTGGFER